MKNSKTLLFSVMLLLAVAMLFVSCNPETGARATNDEDKALVTGVVKDVSEPKEGTTSIDYNEALDPYVNEAINALFGGEGTTLDGVTFKLTTVEGAESTKYSGGIAGLANINLTIDLKDVDVTTEEATVKRVNGTICYTGDPDTITGNVTFGDATYTGNDLVDFFNEVFGEDILPKCAKKFFTDGVTVDGERLSVYAKGSIKYNTTELDNAGNTYTTIETIKLEEFSLKTKEDITIQAGGNKYSLDLSGSNAQFDFEPDDENKDEQNLKKISVPSVTAKLGITQPNGTKHTIEITTSFEYPGTSTSLGFEIPFSFKLSSVKIDDQQIDNLSMYSLLISALVELFK